MRYIWILLLAFSTTRCGVEAGNAGTTKGKMGNVKFLFTQESLNSSESLSLSLAGLDLFANDSSDSVSVDPSVESVDLFSLTSDESVVVAESQQIPVGTYNQVSIRLKGEKPIRYRDGSGQDRQVSLSDSEATSFYVKQTFVVAEGDTTEIVLSLDPYRSLEQDEAMQDRYVFKPRGEVRAPGQELLYKGTTTVSGALWVCAYAYAVNKPIGPRPTGEIPFSGTTGGKGPIGPGGFAPDDDDKRGPGSGSGRPGGRGGFNVAEDEEDYRGGVLSDLLGPLVEARGSFETKDALLKDTTANCARAFAKAPVINGKYELRHLFPANYSLRVFTATGYEDLSPDISVLP